MYSRVHLSTSLAEITSQLFTEILKLMMFTKQMAKLRHFPFAIKTKPLTLKTLHRTET